MIGNLTVAMTCLWWSAGAGGLDESSDGRVYSPQRAFRIPLQLSAAERKEMSSIRLYYTRDQGKTWVKQSEGGVDQEMVTFRTDSDGEFWFSIALVDKKGKQSPADVKSLEAGLKVVVDTAKPTLVLKPVKGKNGERGVRWEAKDDLLDVQTLRLAVWENETDGWKSHEIPLEANKVVWFPKEMTVVKMQACVKDRCGHQAILQVSLEKDGNQFKKTAPAAFVMDEAPTNTPNTATTAVASAAPSAPPAATRIPRAVTKTEKNDAIQQVKHTEAAALPPAVAAPAAVPPAPPAAAAPVANRNRTAPEPRNFSPSRRLEVNYELDNSNEAVSVQLWGTQDNGKSWSKVAVDEDNQSPLVADFEKDGVWGLRIVVCPKSAGDCMPKEGAESEMVVDIDTVSPYVKLESPNVTKEYVVLKWQANDSNMADAPIKLLCSESAQGPWKVIATKLENSGEYKWNTTQAAVPAHCFVRVEAEDNAGNIGAAQSIKEVAFETSKPATGRMVGIRPKVERK